MPGNIRAPRSFALAQIQTQHGYKDEKSLEKKTGVVKRKYKLCGNIVVSLGIYTFFVMTSNETACEAKLTLVINKQHWENRIYINGTSYLDIKRIEALNKSELLLKCTDIGNGFKCVGRLCDEKYKELQLLTKNIGATRRQLPRSTQSLIQDAVDSAGISDAVIQSLGLPS